MSAGQGGPEQGAEIGACSTCGGKGTLTPCGECGKARASLHTPSTADATTDDQFVARINTALTADAGGASLTDAEAVADFLAFLVADVEKGYHPSGMVRVTSVVDYLRTTRIQAEGERILTARASTAQDTETPSPTQAVAASMSPAVSHPAVESVGEGLGRVVLGQVGEHPAQAEGAGEPADKVIRKHLFTLYPGEVACDCEWTAKAESEGRLLDLWSYHLAAMLSTDEGAGEVERLRAAIEALADEWEQAAERETTEIGFRKEHHRDWPKIADLRAVVDRAKDGA